MKTITQISIGGALIFGVLFGIKSCMKHEARPCGNCGVEWIKHIPNHTRNSVGEKLCPHDLQRLRANNGIGSVGTFVECKK